MFTLVQFYFLHCVAKHWRNFGSTRTGDLEDKRGRKECVSFSSSCCSSRARSPILCLPCQDCSEVFLEIREREWVTHSATHSSFGAQKCCCSSSCSKVCQRHFQMILFFPQLFLSTFGCHLTFVNTFSD